MHCKLVSDSSSNLFALEGADFVSVPLKIVAGDTEYVDDRDLDLAGMVADLKKFRGKSGSSCPNVGEWLEAFGDAAEVFALTISQKLSGSYAAARTAAEEFLSANPARKIFVMDSAAAGPEMCMLLEKLRELIGQGLSFEKVKEKVVEYHRSLHTLFCLESLTNLARNGRVSPAVATIAGVLGIRVVGDVKHGQITPVFKPRGQKKATQTLVDMMTQRGLYDGATVRIAHCFGQENAAMLRDAVLNKFPNCRVLIERTTGLCSFYAEAGGLMIGMEGGIHPHKDQA